MRLVIFISIFFLALSAALISTAKTMKRLRSNRKKRSWLEENGKKVKVYFKDCKLISQENIQDAVPDSMPSRIEILDSLYDQDRNNRQINVSESILVYDYKYGNQSIQFRSEKIIVPLISLQFRLDQRISTSVYYDPNNPSKYFFDLDFLT